MMTIEAIKIANNKARKGDLVTWLEFKGTKKEVSRIGRVLKVDEMGVQVAYDRPSEAYVHFEKITSI